MLRHQMERTILFAGVPTFLVACHVAANPSLDGRPLAILTRSAGDAATVLDASLSARAAGVREGLGRVAALRCCPGLLVMTTDPPLYWSTASRMLALLRDYSPLVEPLRPGGAWCDVTGHASAVGTGTYAAHALRRRLRMELGLDACLGVAPNKLLARMAARLAEPEPARGTRPTGGGVAVLRRAEVPTRLWPLPAGDLPGVGSSLAARLSGWNVHTIGDMAAQGPGWWQRRLGSAGARLWAAAYGRDDDAVGARTADAATRIGGAAALGLGTDARSALRVVAGEVARQLRERAVAATQVTLTLWEGDGRARTRTHTLPSATDGAEAICTGALRLAAPLLEGGRGAGSVWLAASGLQPSAASIRQASLFEAAAPDVTGDADAASGVAVPAPDFGISQPRRAGRGGWGRSGGFPDVRGAAEGRAAAVR